MGLRGRVVGWVEAGWAKARLHWVLVLTVVIGGNLALGTAGFLRSTGCGAGGACDVFDALYRTVQTFGLNFDMPMVGDKPAKMNMAIQASRFIAAGVTFLGALALIVGTSQEWVRVRWQSWMRDRRYILLGYGDINRAVAAELAGRTGGRRVLTTAIDRSVSAADRRAALAARVLLIEGDVSDPELMARVRLHQAARIFVAAGEDARSIEIATAVAARLKGHDSPPGLYAHVADLSLYGGLTEMKDLSFVRGGDFRPFNMAQEAAHAFVHKAQLMRTARELGQRRVHLVIMGLGNLGEAVLLDTVMNSYAHDLLPPRVTVVDRDIEGVQHRLKAAYPRLFDGTLASMTATEADHGFEAPPEIQFRPLQLDHVDFAKNPLLDALEGDAAPPTAFVICCGDDRLNLSVGMRLELAMDQLARNPVPIFLRQWSSEFGNETRAEDPFGLTRIFGNVRQSVGRSVLLDADPDALPRLMVMAYDWTNAAQKAKVDPGLSVSKLGLDRVPPVKDQVMAPLSENIAEANRRLARHLPFKLAGLGLSWRGSGEGMLPRIDLEGEGQDPPSLEATPLLDRIAPLSVSYARRHQAWIEHCRWCVDRAVFGWRQSPVRVGGKPQRDNQRRFHVNMVPYAKLVTDDPDKLKFDEAGLEAVLVKIAHDSVTEPDTSEARPLAYPTLAEEMRVPQPGVAYAVQAGVTGLDLRIDPDFLKDLAAGKQGEEWGRVQAFVVSWLGRAKSTRLRFIVEAPADARRLQALIGGQRGWLAGVLRDQAKADRDKGKAHDWPVECSVTRLYGKAAEPEHGPKGA